MKKGFVVGLSFALVAVLGLVGGWLTFPMLFAEAPPSNNNEAGTPTVTLATVQSRNEVFTDELISNVSSVRYYRTGLHQDEAPLYTKRSQDVEDLLIALKQLELRLENDTVYPTDQPELGNILYGGCSLTLYLKNGDAFTFVYGGNIVQVTQTVGENCFRKTYSVTAGANLGDTIGQAFQVNI